jgi:CubicO group peptidase (beta-lactamase class C family)
MLRHSLRLTLNLLLLLSTAFAQTKAPATASDPAALKSRLDQIIMEEVHAKSFMGAALVAKGDEVWLNKGYGSADLEWNQANSASTRFRLASVTKQFTAAAVLLLEERGKLSVNDPVKKYLTDAPSAWDAITLHHLLSHTSGVPNLTNLQQFPDYTATMGIKATPAQLIARFRDRPLDFPPGERFSYSNSGYILLGAVIEKVSGMSYAQFVQDNIFTPLGMKDSGYDVTEAILPQRAQGYERGAPSPTNPSGVTHAPFIHMSIPFSAGGLYSTTTDMLKWMQGLTGGKLLKSESVVRMTTPNKDGYAYGLSVRPLGGRKAYSHGGGIEGFNTFLVHYPESQVTVIVLANLNGPAAGSIARNLSAVAHGETVTLPSERKTVNVPLKVLESYVGTYRMAPDFAFTVTLEDGQLQVQATGQRKTALWPESESTFFPKVVEAKFEFVKDAAGKVTHLVLYQGGRQMKAIRE